MLPYMIPACAMGLLLLTLAVLAFWRVLGPGVCPRCGHTGVNFCRHCGAKL